MWRCAVDDTGADLGPDVFADRDAARPMVDRRPFDPGSLLIGLWFAVVGLVAAIIGAERFDDALAFVIPFSFAVTGLGLLLPKRPRRSRYAVYEFDE
jgi:hypothetical protein